MRKQIFEKMKRYVELSKKFTKSQKEVFTDYIDNRALTGTLTGVASSGSSYVGEFYSTQSKEPTRAEDIMSQAESLALLSDEFDEYNKLKEDLSIYFKIVTKLKD